MWMTASEIATLRLPELPATDVGIRARAQKDAWRSRRRAGRGGGVEFALESLPAEARKAYLGTDPTPAIDGNRHDPDKMDAKLTIIQVAAAWRKAQSLSLRRGEAQFSTLYNEGLIDVPDWTRRIVPHLSAASLARWRKIKDAGGYRRLGGDYGNRSGTSRIERAASGAVAVKIAALKCKQPHLTAYNIKSIILSEFKGVFGKNPPPVRAFQRFIAEWKDKNAESYLYLTNPDKWKGSRRFATGRMYDHITTPNQLWEIDASPADVMTTEGRRNLYMVIDIATRRVMVSVTKTARSDAMLALIRRAMLVWGVPTTIRTDNGKDFVSRAAKRVFTALDIHQDIAPPFTPEAKAAVERAFRTLQHDLMPLIPGYVGHNVADRQEIRARKKFARRLGEDNRKIFHIDTDAAGLQSTIDAWIAKKYEHKPHAGLGGKTPFAVAAAYDGVIRKIENERAVDMLLAPAADGDGYRQVTKRGIRVAGAYFIGSGLTPGMRVFVRFDPVDLGRIYAFTDEYGDFIADAICPERAGVDRVAAARAARAEQGRRIRQEVRPLQQEINRIKDTDMVDAVLGEAERQNGNITAFPQRVDAHTTPALKAAGEAARETIGEAAGDAARETMGEAALEATGEAAGEVAGETMGETMGDGARQHLIADMATAKRARTDPMADKERRFARCRDLQKKQINGAAISDDDARWLENYETTPEYHAKAAMESDFAVLEKPRVAAHG